jgi:hypothetical protein
MGKQQKKGIFIETVRGGREVLKVAPPPPSKQATRESATRTATTG